MNVWEMDRVFIDTETTGLSPRRHVVTAIWAERRRADTLEVMASAGGLVTVPPADLAAARPEALAVQGYDPERWRAEARAWPVVWAGVVSRVLGWKAPFVWVAHNAAFDLSMVAGMHDRYGTAPAPDAPRIDTQHEAIPLRHSGAVKSVSLRALAAHFGIEVRSDVHSAEDDVRIRVEVFRALRGDMEVSYGVA